jgi:hypothetical protein
MSKKSGASDIKGQAATQRTVQTSVTTPDKFVPQGRSAAALQRVLRAAPGRAKTGDILTLQRSMGNRAVRRLLEGTAGRQPSTLHPIQAKRIDGTAESADIQEPRTKEQDGLPDDLKVAVEHLSGVSLDGVKVYYNSPEPSRRRALAYTRGAEIYVGPGQEKHLPHETWHAAQQRQGRVLPTARVGAAVFNDDPGLEGEADLMGARANAVRQRAVRDAVPTSGARRSKLSSPTPAAPIQRITQGQLKELDGVLTELRELWNYFNLIPGAAYVDANTLGIYFDSKPIGVIRGKLGAVANSVDRMSGEGVPGSIDDLILGSVTAELETVVEVLADGGSKYLNFVKTDGATYRVSRAHPLRQTVEGLKHAYDTLDALRKPRAATPPRFRAQKAHASTVMMDIPPKPAEAPEAEDAPRWLNRVQQSHSLLTRLRDEYGLDTIIFRGYEGLESRSRTNELLSGLRRVIQQQTHSYLNSEFNLLVDFGATSREAEQKAMVKYTIDATGNVEIRVERVVPKADWDERKKLYAPLGYGVIDPAVRPRQQGLIAKYRLKEFREADARWTLGELNSLDAAFARVIAATPEVASMLEQLVVIRTAAHVSGTEAFYDGIAHTLSITSSTFEDISFAGRALTGVLANSYKIIAHELAHLILAAPHRQQMSSAERVSLSAESSYAKASKSGDIAGLTSRISLLEKTLEEDELFGDDAIITKWKTMASAAVVAEKAKIEAEIQLLKKQLASLEQSAKKSSAAESFLKLMDEAPEESLGHRTRFLTKNFPKPIVEKFVKLMATWRVGPITVYAAQEQGRIDEEMLAEAYALFVVDPQFVRQVSQPMYEWFMSKAFLAPG